MIPMILIIEDEPIIRENMVQTLELMGFDVVEASDGKQGIDLAFSNSPDLILCDIMMQYVDGFEVLRSIRSSTTMNHTPFVFISARFDHQLIQQCHEAGADDYLLKPFRTSQLVDVASRYAKQHSDN